MLLEEIDFPYVLQVVTLEEVVTLKNLVIIGFNPTFQPNYHQFASKLRHFMTLLNLNSLLKKKLDSVLEINISPNKNECAELTAVT